MGKKDTAVVAAIILLIANPLTARASTVNDLYSVYGIEQNVITDNEALDVIDKYNNVKRFIAMYNYIDLSVPDTTSQDMQIVALERRISQIDTELFNGFNLSISEILDLESEQISARESIDRINKTREYSIVYIDLPEADEVPTYSEYLEALDRVESVNKANYIGDISKVELPTDNGEITDHNSEVIRIKCNSPTPVVSVFDGIVSEVTDNLVTVISSGNVIVTYDRLSVVTVKTGDVVNQYQQIGYTISSLNMSMCILDKYYDMWRLFN